MQVKSSFTRDLIGRAFRASIPVMAGYIFIGIGFGIIMIEKGFGLIWVVAMCLLIYSGAMQFVAINLISGGASLLTAAMTSLMVSARHLFYAISMIDEYKQAGAKKAYLIYALTDETYSLVCKTDLPEGMSKTTYCFCVSLFNQCYWVAGCIMGAVIGSQLTFSTEGIDFAMTALFVSTFTQQWMENKDKLSAVTGVAVSVICLIVFGPDKFLIPTMLGITLVLTVAEGVRKRAGKHRGENIDEAQAYSRREESHESKGESESEREFVNRDNSGRESKLKNNLECSSEKKGGGALDE